MTNQNQGQWEPGRGYHSQDDYRDFRGYPVRQGARGYRSEQWGEGEQWPDEPHDVRVGWTVPQGHRGKGPKGYARSDERIREDVCDRLSDDDELDASEVTVTVKDGEVTLEGTVSDRHAKHRAENLADAVAGVRDVHNHLRKDKGMLQEISERIAGSQNDEHGHHAGSGTKSTPANTPLSRGTAS